MYLCEEILLLILSRLPLKSLYRFKWVSKQWLDLITNHVLPQSLPHNLLGFYFHPSLWCYSKTSRPVARLPVFQQINNDQILDSILDATLSFLPTQKFKTLDCCNGLVLCLDSAHRDILYLCNPATRTWDTITNQLSFSWDRFACKLAFDPAISNHYKLVSLSYPYQRDNPKKSPSFRNRHIFFKTWYLEKK